MNWPSSLFTLWRVQPTIEARSRLGERRAQPDGAVAAARARLVGEPDEPRREPAGDVEEMQLLDVRREPAELAGERREQRVADGRLGGDQLAEPVARQDDGLGRG